MISGSDQSASAEDAVAVCGLFDFNAAIPVQAIGKCACEYLRHVLDDNDSRAPGRHRLQEFTQSFRAPGGGANGDDFASCGLMPVRRA
jgi:hypothetical protein